MNLQKGPMAVQGYELHKEEVHAEIGLGFTFGFANFKCMVLVYYKKLPVYIDFLVGLVSLEFRTHDIHMPNAKIMGLKLL